MSFSDVEHFANMHAGCEALVSGDAKSPDAVYALTVLKLHAGDAGLYAGQEGFLDHIKAGAAKAGEWAKKIFEAIKKWFTSMYASTSTKFKALFSGKNDEEKEKILKERRAGLITHVKRIQAAAKNAPEGVDGSDVVSKGDKAIDALEKGVPAGAVIGMDDFHKATSAMETKFIAWVSSKAPKNTESHAEYDKATRELVKFTKPLNDLFVYVNGSGNEKTEK